MTGRRLYEVATVMLVYLVGGAVVAVSRSRLLGNWRLSTATFSVLLGVTGGRTLAQQT